MLDIGNKFNENSFINLLKKEQFDPFSQYKVISEQYRDKIPVATTVVSIKFKDGVIIAGDRRATMGNIISNEYMNKVYKIDDYSAIGISGVVGICIEFVRLLELEFEHYEKIENSILSLEGKINRVASILRSNLLHALSGLVVMPIFVGYNKQAKKSAIYSFDIAGGKYEEREYHAIGSGSLWAKNTIKNFYKSALNEEKALNLVVQSLYEASENDSATGGPSVTKSIMPSVLVITNKGAKWITDRKIVEVVKKVVSKYYR